MSPLEPPDDDLRGLLPDKVPYQSRVFVNRTLRLDQIRVVGFDMDYTLAQYGVALEHLQSRMTLERLVGVHGYPPEVGEIAYDPSFPMRGTVIDKARGHIFKMDAHKHVERVVHGTRRLPKEERHRAYRRGVIRAGHGRYALMDTLFALPEVFLYARIVELQESRAPSGRLSAAGYRKIYDDIRESIDCVHRDGSLKAIIMADLDRYVEQDPHLVATLEAFLVADKRLFLLTNSGWEYTDAVMRHLLDGRHPRRPSWRDWFEVVVVAASKPGFFSARHPFRAGPSGEVATEARFKPGVVYEGGNIRDFERMLGDGGDGVLYVGDHIYGDMLRSKKACAWRTAMIVPELEHELRMLSNARLDILARDRLEAERVALDDELAYTLRAIGRLRTGNGSTEGALHAEEARAEGIQAAIRANLVQTRGLERAIEGRFNPTWGMLLKANAEHSVFGSQVETYACVYTSRVSNFRNYTPVQYFRTPRDLLPHERFEYFGM